MKTLSDKKVPTIFTTRMKPTGGKLNGGNQPIVVTAPAIRANNSRK